MVPVHHALPAKNGNVRGDNLLAGGQLQPSVLGSLAHVQCRSHFRNLCWHPWKPQNVKIVNIVFATKQVTCCTDDVAYAVHTAR